jgi:elongator complex protein 3
MKTNGLRCHCIRCREIKGNVVNYDDIKLEILEYQASDGKEFFISYETDKYLIGFIRLRIVNIDIINKGTVLEDCGLIRELHVYSTLSNVGNNDSFSLQHKGYGRKLIEKAEEITKSFGIPKMAIIAGTGVRNYYRKYGYELNNTYMIKSLI